MVQVGTLRAQELAQSAAMTAVDPIAERTARLADCVSSAAAEAAPLLERAHKRQQRGQPADRLLQRVDELLSAGEAQLAQRQQIACTIAFPEELPVSAYADEVAAAIRQQRAFVLTGETGSGKTTQLPKMLLAAGYGRRGRIAVTQPRRLAAMAVAARLAEECATKPGVIAHAVRFDDRTTDDTLVQVMTDGLLLAECAGDPLLRRYDAIIVDEAHERSCNIDVLLALLKRLRSQRPDLLIAITSATIDAEHFANFLAVESQAPVPIVAVPGRLFPVAIHYRDPGDADLGYLSAAIQQIEQVHHDEPAGDILCFLPTERDILEARRRLQQLPGARIVPLFSRLNAAEQRAVFQSVPGRKIVLSTNIAETSLTVPGIRYVIDTGMARLKRYQAGTRTERLPVAAVSQASLNQRSGRAGRLGPGVCYRLMSEADAQGHEAFTTPEIKRSNLAGVQLNLYAMGLGNGAELDWLEPPSLGDWQQAQALLDELGALEQYRGQWRLSQLGRRMAHMPTDPQVARMLLAGVEEGVSHEACTIAAFLSIQDPRLRPVGEEAKADSAHAKFRNEAGDIASILQLWDAWQACSSNSQRSRFCEQSFCGWRRMREWADVWRQLWQSLASAGKALGGLAKDQNASGSPRATPSKQIDSVHRAVLTGMLGQVMRYDTKARCYRGIGNKELVLHPGSALKRRGKEVKQAPNPPWLVACEVVHTSRTFARCCAPIMVDWIVEFAGNRLKRTYGEPYFESDSGRVVCREQVTWKGLALREHGTVAAERVDAVAAQRCFVEQALAADAIRARLPALQHNRRLLSEVQAAAIKLRDPLLRPEPETIAQAYQQLLAACGFLHVEREAAAAEPDQAAAAANQGPALTNVAALKKYCRDYGDKGLRLSLDAFCSKAQQRQIRTQFPDEIRHDGMLVHILYSHNLGSESDGVTLRLRESAIDRMETWRLERAVPGLCIQQVEAWCRSLAKADRRALQPIEYAAIEMTEQCLATASPITAACGSILRQRLGEHIRDPEWAQLPDYLRPIIQIIDGQGKTLQQARDWSLLAGSMSADPLAALRAQHGSDAQQYWPGERPQRLQAGSLRGYCGLLRSRNAQAEAAVRWEVFADQAAAQAWHADGMHCLVECFLHDDLAAISQQLNPGDGLGGPGAAIARAAALAAAIDEEMLLLWDDTAVNEMLARCSDRLQRKRSQVHEVLRRLQGVASAVQQRLKRGASGLQGMGVLSTAARLRDRLCAPAWWTAASWQYFSCIPDWLDTVVDIIDQKPAIMRQAQRAERLAQDVDGFTLNCSYRAAVAMGEASTWQRCRFMAEECHWALLQNRKPRHGAHEGSARSGMQALQKQVHEAEMAWHHAAEGLRLIQPFLLRASGPVRDAFADECEQSLRRGLDTTIGADHRAQIQAMGDLERRIRAFLDN